MRAADHEVVARALLDGIVELALITWPCAEGRAADLTPLLRFHEPVVLVTHPGHPLARRRVVTEDELVRLARQLLRLRWWTTPHPQVSRLVERTGLPFDVPMETARQLLLSGVGAGFFTRTYVADELARGLLVQLEVRRMGLLYRDSALVRRSRSVPLSPASAALIRAIAVQAERLALMARAGERTRRGRG
jgi:DNA-binding transcriptional LysR family regulator